MTSKIERPRVELLTDERGAYGVGIVVPNFGGRAADFQISAIYRPDRIPEEEKFGLSPILQPIPPTTLRPVHWGAEGQIADQLHEAMIAAAGLPRKDPRNTWWSDDPKVQAVNRQKYYGLKRAAIAITNRLVYEALAAAAAPDLLKIARRFPLKCCRWQIYKAICRSARMAQLAETFPLLAYLATMSGHYADREKIERRAELRRLIEAGAKLSTIAHVAVIPMALRRIKPGVVATQGITEACELDERSLWELIPPTTEAQKRWAWAMYRASTIGGPYSEWVARNAHLMGNTKNVVAAQISDISDWVRASYAAGIPAHVQRALGGHNHGSKYITRPFSPDMSLTTVRDLCGAWHEAVALADPKVNVPLPAPWRGAEKIDDMDIVPLTSTVEIALEGRTMHHCVATYIDRVVWGDCYIFSLRNGHSVATIEVVRAGETAQIAQMRGPCNAMVSPAIAAKIKKWARQKDKWTLPPKEQPKLAGWDPDDCEIPF